MSDSHFSDKDIQLAGFFVRAKPVMRRVGLIVLIVLDVVLILSGLYYWGQYFAQSRIMNQQSTIAFVDSSTQAASAARSAVQPKSLQSVAVKILEGSGETRDFIALVENPNARWQARISYSFAGQGQTDVRSAVISPGERRVLGVYGSPEKMSSARLVFDNIVWDRVDRHEVDDMSEFTAERLQVPIENPLYLNADADVDTDRVTFTIKNDSPFSYFSVRVAAVMYFGNDIVGVEEVDISPFRSGDSQDIEIHTRSRGVKPTKIEVLPHVNIFDEAAYIEIGS